MLLNIWILTLRNWNIWHFLRLQKSEILNRSTNYISDDWQISSLLHFYFLVCISCFKLPPDTKCVFIECQHRVGCQREILTAALSLMCKKKNDFIIMSLQTERSFISVMQWIHSSSPDVMPFLPCFLSLYRCLLLFSQGTLASQTSNWATRKPESSGMRCDTINPL